MTAHWEGALDNVASDKLQAIWSQLSDTWNEKIGSYGTPEQARWKVLQPATGTGKTQGLALYCSMLPRGNDAPGVLIVICQDVLQCEEAADFVIQYTGATVDGRTLRHDDVIDALSYVVSACADVLSADDTELMSASVYTAEELVTMPLRRRILSEDEIAVFVEEGEEEEINRLKLQRAIEDQATLLIRGLDTTRLDRYIAQLRTNLEKMQKARRRIVLPTPHHQSGRITATERSRQLQRGLIGDEY